MGRGGVYGVGSKGKSDERLEGWDTGGVVCVWGGRSEGMKQDRRRDSVFRKENKD